MTVPPTASWSSEPGLVKWILLAGGVQVFTGLLAAVAWLWFGDPAWIRLYFQYQGPAFLGSIAILEVVLCRKAWRHFSTGDPLRPAWMFLTLAAACRLGGILLSELPGAAARLNPGPLWPAPLDPQSVIPYQRLGLSAGGPVATALLGCGLLLVVRAYRRHRLRAKLGPLGLVIFSIAALFTLRELYDSAAWPAGPHDALGSYKALRLVTNPLLTLSLYVALVLRRSAEQMAGGLISRCWGAYSTGIFATVCGNLTLWAVHYQHVPWPANTFASLVWYVPGMAYVLGAAYQVSAIRRAQRAADELSPPQTCVP